jgi:hypothetical protein
MLNCSWDYKNCNYSKEEFVYEKESLLKGGICIVKKISRVKSVAFVIIAITAIICTSAYASPNEPSAQTSVKALGNDNTNIGSLAKPADAEARGTETKLSGNAVTLQPFVNVIGNSKASTLSKTAPSFVIKPLVSNGWTNIVIGYNTITRFTTSTGGNWIIRAGIEAWFSFDMSSDQNTECGFINSNGTKTVLHNGLASGIGTSYTPTVDVVGAFYIWNKSSGAITINSATMTY